MEKRNVLSSLVGDHLDHPWIRGLQIAWPFGIARRIGFPRGLKNQTDFCLQRAVPISCGTPMHQWRLELVEAVSELHAEVELRLFPGDGSRCRGVIEYQGKFTNGGTEPIKILPGVCSLDWRLRDPELGEPWIRTVAGGPFPELVYPPHGYSVHDRQLLRHDQYQHSSPYNFAFGATEDGRCSVERMPMMVVTDGRQRYGIFVMQEWFGLWRMGLRTETRSLQDQLVIWFGFEGLDLNLEPGRSIPLPVTTIGFFHGDLETGSNSLRRHIHHRLTPLLDGRKPLPPCSFNHWFCFENEISDNLMRPVVDRCAQVGIEYFVIDAGWFKGGFRAGVGNWLQPDPEKFPDGVEPFARYVADRGLKYGMWVEPEAAIVGTQIVNEHPDWFFSMPESVDYDCLLVDPKEKLMNFGLPEVRQWWVEFFRQMYDRWQLRWVRWDANTPPRPMWENGESAGSKGWNQINHVLGVYETLDQILEACPDLLIEQCASGGNRVEPGILRRGHTIWMNDQTTNTHIIRAFFIGGNTFLPANYLNTMLCQKRKNYSPLDYLSHSMGSFGISERIHEWPDTSLKDLASAIARFKRVRPILLEDYHAPEVFPKTPAAPACVRFGDGLRQVVFEFRPPEALCLEPSRIM